MEDGNTSALNAKILSDRDENISESQDRQERVRSLAAKKLEDVAFICEAFAGMADDIILQTGHLVFHGSGAVDAAIGFYVRRGMASYALQVAEKEIP